MRKSCVTNAYARQNDRDADQGDRPVCAEAGGLQRSRAPVRAGRQRDRERVAGDDHRPQEEAGAERRERVSKDVEKACHCPHRDG